MQLINIANKGKTLFLFLRNDKGEQIIKEVNDFYPYYYEIHPDGNHLSYFGDKLKLLIAGNPSDVAKRRSANAFEADVHFCKKYLIDKVDKLEKCPIKYSFIDIETLTKEFPNVQRADKPISCISAYNSMYDNVQTFYLEDYKSEYELIRDFIIYMKKEKFDLWLSWNVGFDFNYLYNRVERIKDAFVDMGLIKNRKYEDFATLISPIGISRYGGEIKHPAGISVVDYLAWDKKITLNRRRSYKLDEVMHEDLKKPFRDKVDFSKLSLELKKKNIEDVMWLAEFEKKNKYIDYFNEIRMLTKVSFEDMDYNSRMLDMLLLQEAHNQKIVLPMKPSEDRGTLEEKPDYKGAFREVFQKGCYYNSGVYDISEAYPRMILGLMLDPANLTDNVEEGLAIQVKHLIKDENDEHHLRDKNGKFKFELAQKVYFKQNPNALLPKVTKKLVTLKSKIKKQLEEISVNNSNYKRIKLFYNAIKTIVNSCYGVFGNRFFRLFSEEVAFSTTFLVRDLLTYVIEKLEEQGHQIIYADTDSIIIANNTENISNELNKLAKQWAKERFEIDNITIEFSHEGCFEKLFILALCRYCGWLRTPKGELEEIEKGIEAKRKNSTIFIQKFQRELIDNKLLAKEPKEKIIKWIKDEIKNFPNQSLEDIAFPCKVAKAPEDYRNRPIFIRALESTNNFDVRVGDNFYYIYVKPQGYEMKTIEQKLIQTYNKKGEVKGFKNVTEKRIITACEINLGSDVWTNREINNIRENDILNRLKDKKLYKSRKIEVKDKAKDVMAFSKENKSHITNEMIDWSRMVERNILMKIEGIFGAMNWNLSEVSSTTLKNTPKSGTVMPESNLNKQRDTIYPKKLMDNKQNKTQTTENKEDKSKFAEEVSKQTCLSSTKESRVQVSNSAPDIEVEFPSLSDIVIIKNTSHMGTLKIKEVSYYLAKDIILKNHYSHKWNTSFGKINIGIFKNENNKCLGVASFGNLMNPKSYNSIGQGFNQQSIIELNRLWIDDELGKNAETILLGACWKIIKKHYPFIKAVQSFADGRLGCGTIYKASNFGYYGYTKTLFYKDIGSGIDYHKIPMENTKRPSGMIKLNVLFVQNKLVPFYVKTYKYIYTLQRKVLINFRKQPYPEYDKRFIKIEKYKHNPGLVFRATVLAFILMQKEDFNFLLNHINTTYTDDIKKEHFHKVLLNKSILEIATKRHLIGNLNKLKMLKSVNDLSIL